jgi:hypothetical protein
MGWSARLGGRALSFWGGAACGIGPRPGRRGGVIPKLSARNFLQPAQRPVVDDQEVSLVWSLTAKGGAQASLQLRRVSIFAAIAATISRAAEGETWPVSIPRSTRSTGARNRPGTARSPADMSRLRPPAPSEASSIGSMTLSRFRVGLDRHLAKQPGPHVIDKPPDDRVGIQQLCG